MGVAFAARRVCRASRPPAHRPPSPTLGRYRKFQRGLPQSPWDRKAGGSVEVRRRGGQHAGPTARRPFFSSLTRCRVHGQEIIVEGLKELVGSDDIKFSSAGREVSSEKQVCLPPRGQPRDPPRRPVPRTLMCAWWARAGHLRSSLSGQG